LTTGELPVVIFRQELLRKTVAAASLPARFPEPEVREASVSRSTAVQKTKKENPFVRYFKDTRAEVGKVTWPTRETGFRLTGVVLAVTSVSAIVLFAIDSFFSYLVALLVQAL
jgi:preprotein translocase subunit SecE